MCNHGETSWGMRVLVLDHCTCLSPMNASSLFGSRDRNGFVEVVDLGQTMEKIDGLVAGDGGAAMSCQTFDRDASPTTSEPGSCERVLGATSQREGWGVATPRETCDANTSFPHCWERKWTNSSLVSSVCRAWKVLVITEQPARSR